MRRFINVRTRLFDCPLLLTEEYASVVATALADRLDIEPVVSPEVVRSYIREPRDKLFDLLGFEPLIEDNPLQIGYPRPGDSPVLDRKTGIAIYPVVGSMVHRSTGMDALSGGLTSYTDIQSDLTSLMANPKVKGILMDLDTPGGEAAGITELAQFMRSAAAQTGKPIWGLANSKACSGGYWLGAACEKLYAAPMSSVGSVGVVTVHTDASKAIEKKGLVHTFIYAGAKKVDGSSLGPLSDTAKATIQLHVDQLYGQFVGAVAQLRGIEPKSVRDTEAGVFDPDTAQQLGLIDGLADLGGTLALMAEHISTRTTMVSGATLKANDMFTQADLDAAKASGVTEGAAQATAQIADALAIVQPGDASLEAFSEMLKDGMSAPIAAKHAAKLNVPAPVAKTEAPVAAQTGAQRTVSQLEARFAETAPGVGADTGIELSDKDKRMAEIKAQGAAFNQARGYAQ